VAVLVWLAAGAAASYGVLHGLGQRPDVPLPMPPVTAWAVDTAMVARALGATTSTNAQPAPQVVAEPAGPSRYTVLGVVAPTASDSGSGVALVSVDGQRPLPYRVGAVLDGRWQVQSVQRRAVVLVAMAGAAVPQGTAPLTQTLRVPDPASLSPR
jgi:general secretion pathway protein C